MVAERIHPESTLRLVCLVELRNSSFSLRNFFQPRCRDFKGETERAFYRDAPVAKINIVKNLAARAGFEAVVELGDFRNVGGSSFAPVADEITLVAKAARHLHEKLAGVNELNLFFPRARF